MHAAPSRLYVVLLLIIAALFIGGALGSIARAEPNLPFGDSAHRAADYAKYAHIEPHACGADSLGRNWRWTAWWALREQGIGPLAPHPRSGGRSWLGALCCTLWHESRLDAAAYRPAHLNPNGGNDVGLCQFNDQWTDAELARDPHRALRRMAQWWREGGERRWNAYRYCTGQ